MMGFELDLSNNWNPQDALMVARAPLSTTVSWNGTHATTGGWKGPPCEQNPLNLVQIVKKLFLMYLDFL